MKNKGQVLFWISILTTLAAIGTHVYLTNHHYNFKFGGSLDSGGICNVSETVNCDRTTASEYSEVFGVPVSIFGGLINLALLFLLALFRMPLIGPDAQARLAGPIRLTTLGIFSVSVIMGFLSYVVLHTVCPACTLAYILSFVGLISAWMLTSKAPLFLTTDLKTYGIMFAFVLFGAFLIHSNQMRANGGKEKLATIDLFVDQWQRTPEKVLNPVDPLVMNASSNSKMKLVEFADYLCGHCANAYPIIHNFVKTHPDVEFSFQAFPLDGECNAAIGRSEGTRCLLARIAHCAGQQKSPWETQEWIFTQQRNLLSKDNVKAQLKEKVADLGLDEKALMACVEDPKTQDIIRQQAKVGVDVGVKGTPSLFINGKKVPSGFSVPLLEKIYRSLN